MELLYLNLLGRDQEYEFRFAHRESDLPTKESNDAGVAAEKLWYPVPELAERLRIAMRARNVADEIAASAGIRSQEAKDTIRDNVDAFFLSVFVWPAIGISSVAIDRDHRDRERRRIVELFRRLNDGGTRLSAFDLAASMYKGLDYRMEAFFHDVREFEDMGIGQDEGIKLLFLLQSNHAKEVTDIQASDAHFAIENRDRIVQSLRAVRQFLQYAGLYSYYCIGGRSVIPLYFIAYHLFHKPDPPDALVHVYDNHDIKNDDFLSLKRWVYLSVLNGVFSRGRGWIPYETGIRKILGVVQTHKGQQFPTEVVFNVYRSCTGNVRTPGLPGGRSVSASLPDQSRDESWQWGGYRGSIKGDPRHTAPRGRPGCRRQPLPEPSSGPDIWPVPAGRDKPAGRLSRREIGFERRPARDPLRATPGDQAALARHGGEQLVPEWASWLP